MTDAAWDLCLLYDLRRHEIAAVASRLSDALEEDLRVNADMFDITCTTFSKNRHPNATMRALEADLAKADLTLLHLLISLYDIGMELTQGLGDFPDKVTFAEAAARRYEALCRGTLDAPILAHLLTEIKAEHALKRLLAAMQMMDLSA